jgi:glutamine synthetase
MAIRIPGGKPSARRIEHRVAGGDANPYLMIAAILGAALKGIQKGKEATNPISGNGYEAEGTSIIKDWNSAIQCFSSSEKIKEIFDPLLIRSFIDCKMQEFNYFSNKSVDEIKQITINAI